jgi:hypothetical protein
MIASLVTVALLFPALISSLDDGKKERKNERKKVRKKERKKEILSQGKTCRQTEI